MSETASSKTWLPRPSPVSGVMECGAELTFGALLEAAEQSGWSADGIQPEVEEASLAELLERRQPRPLHWGGGLLPSRCCRLVASRDGASGYASIRAPRKASGPDLAYLFVGGEGVCGTIQRVSLALVRPAPRYLAVIGQFEDAAALFEAAQGVSLLDPLATRRLDWGTRELRAWVPVRAAAVEPYQASLEALGLQTEMVAAVPRQARLLEPARSGPCLVLSADYHQVAEVLQEAEAGRGRRRLDVRLGYPDCHGLQAVLTVSKAGFKLLEGLYEALATEDVYDLTLHEPSGLLRRPFQVLEVPGAGGKA